MQVALQDRPPSLDPTEYGWEIDHQGTLIPRIAQQGTLFALPYILRLIRCQCKTSECRTAACICANIGCTMFCLCEGGALCKNPHTQNAYMTTISTTKMMKQIVDLGNDIS